LIQLQLALFDELHCRDRGHRLGHRGEPENRVERHLGTLGEVTRAERTLIEDPLVCRRCRDDTRHFLGVGGPTKNRVDLSVWLHRASLSLRGGAPDGRSDRRGSGEHRCRLENFAAALSPAGHGLSSR
jgi:hypothetical protein